MESKYFLSRIQKEGDAISKGIEVHDTLDAAVLSFWGRMKLGYNSPEKPEITFISCKVMDGAGNVVGPYDMTWLKDAKVENIFFLHHIRKDGETYTKDIDVCADYDTALRNFAAQMEYGYSNPRFPAVELVSCMVTDLLSGGMILRKDTWAKQEEAPAPEETDAPNET